MTMEQHALGVVTVLDRESLGVLVAYACAGLFFAAVFLWISATSVARFYQYKRKVKRLCKQLDDGDARFREVLRERNQFAVELADAERRLTEMEAKER